VKKLGLPLRLTLSFLVSVSFVFSLSTAFCKSGEKLIIFHAGSLTLPFAKMEEEFEEIYPGVDILREPAGSIRCIRKVTELKKPCDIIASADYALIDRFLVPQFASWNILFATNQIVLCYTGKSRYADVINRENWYKIWCCNLLRFTIKNLVYTECVFKIVP